MRNKPIEDRLEYIVDMRSLLEVAFGSAITTNTRVLNTTVIVRQIGVGSRLLNGSYYGNLLMIRQTSMATKTDCKGNKEMIGSLADTVQIF